MDGVNTGARSGVIGKQVQENILQVSRDENDYIKKSSKIFSKDVLKESQYKRQIPDYLRIMEDPRNFILTLYLLSVGN